MSDLPATNRTMLTEVKPEGVLELYLADLPMPTPKDHEVVVKVQATPINPSDLGLMVGAADVTSARAIERAGLPGIAMNVPEAGMRFMAGRIGQALPIGNEGCGVVVAAGAAPEAQALMGKTVALIGGEIYAQYRCLAAQMCMPLPDGTAPEDGASCFVNPLTSLGFVETMKLEGYKAIVHAAAASNLGQMLVKICKADGIPLINIVRSQAQVDLLKGIGAEIVLNSNDDDFVELSRSAAKSDELFFRSFNISRSCCVNVFERFTDELDNEISSSFSKVSYFDAATAGCGGILGAMGLNFELNTRF